MNNIEAIKEEVREEGIALAQSLKQTPNVGTPNKPLDGMIKNLESVDGVTKEFNEGMNKVFHRIANKNGIDLSDEAQKKEFVSQVTPITTEIFNQLITGTILGKS